MGEKYLLREVNAQGLLHWMNENLKKDNGKEFNRNDIQAYITRRHLPEYLGGNEIVVIPKKHCTIRMYNVLANENNQVYKDEI